MVLATDEPVPATVIEELRRSPGILQVQAVSD
jgi:predicted regulator of amino acid metabolism with ACT domain